MSSLSPTPEQLAAIRSDAKSRVIIAHPGTGKTFTLVEILADLLERRGRASECITAVSFTRNAAAELRERAFERIGPVATGITFGTSHSLALSIVRSRAGELGYPGGVTIYDEQDQHDVIADVIETLGLKVSVAAVLKSLDKWRMGEPGEFDRQVVQAIEEYEAKLKRAGAVDLSGILPLAIGVLRSNAVARSEWQWKARYLIVDEFHDTAADEQALYAHLMPLETVVVGDPNQEIYAFRGTSNRFLREAATADGAAVFYLTQSFRSGKPVVDAANALISHNPFQPSEQLRPAHRRGGVLVHTHETYEAQARSLADAVRKPLARGKTCALLTRTNRELAFAVRALRAAGAPVRELSLPREWFALEEVRTFHAALRAVYNPFDEIATRVLCKNWPGLPAHRSAEWFAAAKKANETDRPILEALKWDLFGWSVPLGVLGETVAAVLGKKYGDEGRTTRVANVYLALARLHRWIEFYGDDLEAFVDWLQRREIEATTVPDDDKPAVECGTIHSAKGLEWDAVLIVGCHETHMPSAKADLEEERRLAYVGVTRARLVLELFYCQETDCAPSRFLSEATSPA